MAIELSASERAMMEGLTAEKFPETNEDVLAQAQIALAELAKAIERARESTAVLARSMADDTGFTGKSADTVKAGLTDLFSNNDYLGAAAEAADFLASFTRDLRAEVVYVKASILGQLALVIFELAELALQLEFGNIAGAIQQAEQVVVAEIEAKVLITQMLRRLGKFLVDHSVRSAALGFLLDPLIQLIQMANGTRGKWSTQNTAQMAEFTAVGLGTGLALKPFIARFDGALRSVLGRDLSAELGADFQKSLPLPGGGEGEAADRGLGVELGAVFARHVPSVVSGFGRRAAGEQSAALQRGVANAAAAFVADVTSVFERSLPAEVAGVDAAVAREAGRSFGEAFAREWGQGPLEHVREALAESLRPFGTVLGEPVVGALSHDVPSALLVRLGKAFHLGDEVAGLGTAVVGGSANMVAATAVYGLVFGPDHQLSFSPAVMGAGGLFGAVSHVGHRVITGVLKPPPTFRLPEVAGDQQAAGTPLSDAPSLDDAGVGSPTLPKPDGGAPVVPSGPVVSSGPVVPSDPVVGSGAGEPVPADVSTVSVGDGGGSERVAMTGAEGDTAPVVAGVRAEVRATGSVEVAGGEPVAGAGANGTPLRNAGASPESAGVVRPVVRSGLVSGSGGVEEPVRVAGVVGGGSESAARIGAGRAGDTAPVRSEDVQVTPPPMDRPSHDVTTTSAVPQHPVAQPVDHQTGHVAQPVGHLAAHAAREVPAYLEAILGPQPHEAAGSPAHEWYTARRNQVLDYVDKFSDLEHVVRAVDASDGVFDATADRWRTDSAQSIPASTVDALRAEFRATAGKVLKEAVGAGGVPAESVWANRSPTLARHVDLLFDFETHMADFKLRFEDRVGGPIPHESAGSAADPAAVAAEQARTALWERYKSQTTQQFGNRWRQLAVAPAGDHEQATRELADHLSSQLDAAPAALLIERGKQSERHMAGGEFDDAAGGLRESIADGQLSDEHLARLRQGYLDAVGDRYTAQSRDLIGQQTWSQDALEKARNTWTDTARARPEQTVEWLRREIQLGPDRAFDELRAQVDARWHEGETGGSDEGKAALVEEVIGEARRAHAEIYGEPAARADWTTEQWQEADGRWGQQLTTLSEPLAVRVAYHRGLRLVETEFAQAQARLPADAGPSDAGAQRVREDLRSAVAKDYAEAGAQANAAGGAQAHPALVRRSVERLVRQHAGTVPARLRRERELEATLSQAGVTFDRIDDGRWEVGEETTGLADDFRHDWVTEFDRVHAQVGGVGKGGADARGDIEHWLAREKVTGDVFAVTRSTAADSRHAGGGSAFGGRPRTWEQARAGVVSDYGERFDFESQLALKLDTAREDFRAAVARWQSSRAGSPLSEEQVGQAEQDFTTAIRAAFRERFGLSSFTLPKDRLPEAWREFRGQLEQLTGGVPTLLDQHAEMAAVAKDTRATLADRMRSNAVLSRTSTDRLTAELDEDIRTARDRAVSSGQPDSVLPEFRRRTDELVEGMDGRVAAAVVRERAEAQWAELIDRPSVAELSEQETEQLHRYFLAEVGKLHALSYGWRLRDHGTSPERLVVAEGEFSFGMSQLADEVRARATMVPTVREATTKFDVTAKDVRAELPAAASDPVVYGQVREEFGKELGTWFQASYRSLRAADTGADEASLRERWQAHTEVMLAGVRHKLEFEAGVHTAITHVHGVVEQANRDNGATVVSPAGVKRVNDALTTHIRTEYKKAWRTLAEGRPMTDIQRLAAERQLQPYRADLPADVSARLHDEALLEGTLPEAAETFGGLGEQRHVGTSTYARLADGFRTDWVTTRHKVSGRHELAVSQWLDSEKSQGNVFGARLAWHLTLDHFDHTADGLPVADSHWADSFRESDLAGMVTAQRLEVTTLDGHEVTVQISVDPATGHTVLAARTEDTDGNAEHELAPVPGLDGLGLLDLARDSVLRGTDAMPVANNLALRFRPDSAAAWHDVTPASPVVLPPRITDSVHPKVFATEPATPVRASAADRADTDMLNPPAEAVVLREVINATANLDDVARQVADIVTQENGGGRRVPTLVITGLRPASGHLAAELERNLTASGLSAADLPVRVVERDNEGEDPGRDRVIIELVTPEPESQWQWQVGTAGDRLMTIPRAMLNKALKDAARHVSGHHRVPFVINEATPDQQAMRTHLHNVINTVAWRYVEAGVAAASAMSQHLAHRFGTSLVTAVGGSRSRVDDLPPIGDMAGSSAASTTSRRDPLGDESPGDPQRPVGFAPRGSGASNLRTDPPYLHAPAPVVAVSGPPAGTRVEGDPMPAGPTGPVIVETVDANGRYVASRDAWESASNMIAAAVVTALQRGDGHLPSVLIEGADLNAQVLSVLRVRLRMYLSDALAKRHVDLNDLLAQRQLIFDIEDVPITFVDAMAAKTADSPITVGIRHASARTPPLATSVPFREGSSKLSSEQVEKVEQLAARLVDRAAELGGGTLRVTVTGYGNGSQYPFVAALRESRATRTGQVRAAAVAAVLAEHLRLRFASRDGSSDVAEVSVHTASGGRAQAGTLADVVRRRRVDIEAEYEPTRSARVESSRLPSARIPGSEQQDRVELRSGDGPPVEPTRPARDALLRTPVGPRRMPGSGVVGGAGSGGVTRSGAVRSGSEPVVPAGRRPAGPRAMRDSGVAESAGPVEVFVSGHIAWHGMFVAARRIADEVVAAGQAGRVIAPVMLRGDSNALSVIRSRLVDRVDALLDAESGVAARRIMVWFGPGSGAEDAGRLTVEVGSTSPEQGVPWRVGLLGVDLEDPVDTRSTTETGRTVPPNPIDSHQVPSDVRPVTDLSAAPSRPEQHRTDAEASYPGTSERSLLASEVNKLLRARKVATRILDNEVSTHLAALVPPLHVKNMPDTAAAIVDAITAQHGTSGGAGGQELENRISVESDEPLSENVLITSPEYDIKLDYVSGTPVFEFVNKSPAATLDGENRRSDPTIVYPAMIDGFQRLERARRGKALTDIFPASEGFVATSSGAKSRRGRALGSGTANKVVHLTFAASLAGVGPIFRLVSLHSKWITTRGLFAKEHLASSAKFAKAVLDAANVVGTPDDVAAARHHLMLVYLHMAGSISGARRQDLGKFYIPIVSRTSLSALFRELPDRIRSALTATHDNGVLQTQLLRFYALDNAKLRQNAKLRNLSPLDNESDQRALLALTVSPIVHAATVVDYLASSIDRPNDSTVNFQYLMGLSTAFADLDRYGRGNRPVGVFEVRNSLDSNSFDDVTTIYGQGATETRREDRRLRATEPLRAPLDRPGRPGSGDFFDDDPESMRFDVTNLGDTESMTWQEHADDAQRLIAPLAGLAELMKRARRIVATQSMLEPSPTVSDPRARASYTTHVDRMVTAVAARLHQDRALVDPVWGAHELSRDLAGHFGVVRADAFHGAGPRLRWTRGDWEDEVAQATAVLGLEQLWSSGLRTRATDLVRRYHRDPPMDVVGADPDGVAYRRRYENMVYVVAHQIEVERRTGARVSSAAELARSLTWLPGTRPGGGSRSLAGGTPTGSGPSGLGESSRATRQVDADDDRGEDTSTLFNGEIGHTRLASVVPVHGGPRMAADRDTRTQARSWVVVGHNGSAHQPVPGLPEDPAGSLAWREVQIRYADAATEYERRLGHYLASREDVNAEVGKILRWFADLNHMDLNSGDRFKLRDKKVSQAYATLPGSVDYNRNNFNDVVSGGNLRERIALLRRLAGDVPEVRRGAAPAQGALPHLELAGEGERSITPPLSDRERMVLHPRTGTVRWGPNPTVRLAPLTDEIRPESVTFGALQRAGDTPSIERIITFVSRQAGYGAVRIDFELLRLALLGVLLSNGSHTFHEVMRDAASARPELTYDAEARYRRLAPLSEEELRHVAVNGMFPDEHAHRQAIADHGGDSANRADAANVAGRSTSIDRLADHTLITFADESTTLAEQSVGLWTVRRLVRSLYEDMIDRSVPGKPMVPVAIHLIGHGLLGDKARKRAETVAVAIRKGIAEERSSRRRSGGSDLRAPGPDDLHIEISTAGYGARVEVNVIGLVGAKGFRKPLEKDIHQQWKLRFRTATEALERLASPRRLGASRVLALREQALAIINGTQVLPKHESETHDLASDIIAAVAHALYLDEKNGPRFAEQVSLTLGVVYGTRRSDGVPGGVRPEVNSVSNPSAAFMARHYRGQTVSDTAADVWSESIGDTEDLPLVDAALAVTAASVRSRDLPLRDVEFGGAVEVEPQVLGVVMERTVTFANGSVTPTASAVESLEAFGEYLADEVIAGRTHVRDLPALHVSGGGDLGERRGHVVTAVITTAYETYLDRFAHGESHPPLRTSIGLDEGAGSAVVRATVDWERPQRVAPGEEVMIDTPVPVAAIDEVRAGAPIAEVRLTVGDRRVAYDVVRVEVPGGGSVREVHIDVDVIQTDLMSIQGENAFAVGWSGYEQLADSLVNRGYRLPSGDQLRLRLTRGEHGDQAHAVFVLSERDLVDISRDAAEFEPDVRRLGNWLGEVLGLGGPVGELLTHSQLALLDSRPEELSSSSFAGRPDTGGRIWLSGFDSIDRGRRFRPEDVVSTTLHDGEGKEFGVSFWTHPREQAVVAAWSRKRTAEGALFGAVEPGERSADPKNSAEQLMLEWPWLRRGFAVVTHSTEREMDVKVSGMGIVRIDGDTLGVLMNELAVFRRVRGSDVPVALIACNADMGSADRFPAQEFQRKIGGVVYSSTGPIAISDVHSVQTVIKDGGHWNVIGGPTPEHDEATVRELVAVLLRGGFRYAAAVRVPGSGRISLSDRAATAELAGTLMAELRTRTRDGGGLDVVDLYRRVEAEHTRPDLVIKAVISALAMSEPQVSEGAGVPSALSGDHLTASHEDGFVTASSSSASRPVSMADIDDVRRFAPVNRFSLRVGDETVSYNVIRVKVRGRWVRELNLTVDVTQPAFRSERDESSYDRVWIQYDRVADSWVNRGERLPSGDELVLRLTLLNRSNADATFTPSAADLAELARQGDVGFRSDYRAFGTWLGKVLGLDGPVVDKRLTRSQLALLDGRPKNLQSLSSAPGGGSRGSVSGLDLVRRERRFTLQDVTWAPLHDRGGKVVGVTFTEDRRERDADVAWARNRTDETLLYSVGDTPSLVVKTEWLKRGAISIVHSNEENILMIAHGENMYMVGGMFGRLLKEIEVFQRLRGTGPDRLPVVMLACMAGQEIADHLQREVGGTVYSTTTKTRVYASQEFPTQVRDGGHWNVFGGPTPEHDAATVRELVAVLMQPNFRYVDAPRVPGATRILLSERAATLELVRSILWKVRQGVAGDGYLDFKYLNEKFRDAHERPDLMVEVVLATLAMDGHNRVLAVSDRYYDGRKWRRVDLTSEARARFTVTGNARWDTKNRRVVRPVRLVPLDRTAPLWDLREEIKNEEVFSFRDDQLDFRPNDHRDGLDKIGQWLAHLADELHHDDMSMPVVRIVGWGHAPYGNRVLAKQEGVRRANSVREAVLEQVRAALNNMVGVRITAEDIVPSSAVSGESTSAKSTVMISVRVKAGGGGMGVASGSRVLVRGPRGDGGFHPASTRLAVPSLPLVSSGGPERVGGPRVVLDAPVSQQKIDGVRGAASVDEVRSTVGVASEPDQAAAQVEMLDVINGAVPDGLTRGLLLSGVGWARSQLELHGLTELYFAKRLVPQASGGAMGDLVLLVAQKYQDGGETAATEFLPRVLAAVDLLDRAELIDDLLSGIGAVADKRAMLADRLMEVVTLLAEGQTAAAESRVAELARRHQMQTSVT